MKVYIKDTQATKEQIYSRGITIDEFSQVVGINYPYMSRILNKRTALSPTLAKRIADELGKEIKDVFEFKENKGDEKIRRKFKESNKN